MLSLTGRLQVYIVAQSLLCWLWCVAAAQPTTLNHSCWGESAQAATAVKALEAVLLDLLAVLLCAHAGDTANISSNGKFGRALSAIESRSLMWLSWAQRLAKECSSGGSSTNSNSPASSATAAADASDEHAEAAAGLAAAIPYQVPVQDVQIHLLHAQVSQSELPTAINGSLVGLVCSAGGVQKHPQHCLGIGLIRAIDARKELLYLLTELPEEQLQQVDTLVVGKLELPDKLQATQQFASPYQGLYCLTSTATGAGMLKSRNNLLRTSLLQGA
eukprot:GHRR01026634.1.p1 GENE.GHRR01026634.1~~GHRR01026634.1.p1  ORF type:complete len:274 (-),score=92.87 GHRR01026634.1:95-916(-)